MIIYTKKVNCIWKLNYAYLIPLKQTNLIKKFNLQLISMQKHNKLQMLELEEGRFCWLDCWRHMDFMDLSHGQASILKSFLETRFWKGFFWFLKTMFFGKIFICIFGFWDVYFWCFVSMTWKRVYFGFSVSWKIKFFGNDFWGEILIKISWV